MFSTQITITQKLACNPGRKVNRSPNDFVEVPDGPLYRYAVPVDISHMTGSSLTLIPGSRVRPETANPSRISDQLWVELPPYDKSQNPSPTDWYQVLRTAGQAATGYPMAPET